MPIYEYKCDSCERKFEKLVRRPSDAVELECPTCGERHLSQQYSTFAAQAGGNSASAGPRGLGTSEGSGMCGSGMCGTPGMCGMN